jgi:hypothetical protein
MRLEFRILHSSECRSCTSQSSDGSKYATEVLSLSAGTILIANRASSAMICVRVRMLSRPLGELSIPKEKDEGLEMVDQRERCPNLICTYLRTINFLVDLVLARGG